MVIVYAPAVVPATGLLVQAVPLPPLQAVTPTARQRSKINMLASVRQAGFLRGLANRSTQARLATPVVFQGNPIEFPEEHVPGLEAVVDMVRSADPGVVPVTLTGLVAPKLKAGGATALAGPLVKDAVRVTLPVNPPAGVIRMADVFPVVAPAATLTAGLVMVKPGGIAEVTVTVAVSLAAM